MHEYWPGADNPPLDECLARVDGCDLLLAIVARRHGWTPAGQAEGEFKSITRLECERANGRVDIIPFFVDETASWPEDKTEDYRLTAASLKGEYDEIPKLAREIPRNKLALEDFRQWLSDGRQRRLFANPEQLRLEIHKALTRWRGEHPEFQSAKRVPGFDPAGYRHWLQRRCESVELLGLDPKDAMNTRLQQVYVPARVAWDNPDPAQLERLGILMDDQHDAPDRRRIELPLLHRLSCESLYVPGSPGAGKTTFCRWLALVAAAGQLPAHPIPTPDDFSETLPADLQGRLPVLCHLRDLNDHRDLLRGSGRWNRKQLEDALAAWLDRTQPGELTGNAWRALMDRGDCLLILDGVDELQSLYRDGPQSHRPRANFLSGLADALPAWQRKNNCVLLTSRPYGLGEADRRRLGLTAAELLPLKEPLQHCFIRRWYAAVDPAHAEEKSEGLIAHLDERADLSELQQSPMLLTALCVKYDEGRRLPRDFHLLYHSVIGQVLHGRYPETTDQQAVRRRLAAVALGMHTGDAVTQERSAPEAAVSYDELDRILAAYAGEEPASEGGANRAAEKREDLISRSGLLLPRGE
ncbi:MAG: NACHT domain-containing protein, partial [Methylococcaceae bacterium]|nr:NACHT domain-containing protein [Methylococcaceae bacterium]